MALARSRKESGERAESAVKAGGFVLAWLPGVLWVQAAVLGPGVDLVSSLGHFCEYLVFGALLTRAVGVDRERSLAVAFAAAVIAASAYGVTDELHQLFVPGRMCDPADWLVDTVGAAMGSLLWIAFSRTRGRAS